ncbi:hypothetical protein C4D60_Mb01t03290 [Musa balbisiana]|uniref:Uncharacterized protein n=1 Tax=Musa balbisiana TaxID=52838 RepID=A0A4S8JJI7_MUSBA|nr:hypothetical protein C4D60_Mb01t03290 [Musa balbisiana]
MKGKKRSKRRNAPFATCDLGSFSMASHSEEQLRAIHNQKWRELSGYLCFLLAVSWESLSSFSCLPLARLGIAECAAACLRLCVSLADTLKGVSIKSHGEFGKGRGYEGEEEEQEKDAPFATCDLGSFSMASHSGVNSGSDMDGSVVGHL